MKFRIRQKKLLITFVVLALLVVVSLVVADKTISHTSSKYLYDDVSSVPATKAGLVLGTAKNIKNKPNLYFKYRIEATLALYHAGKIQCVVVSGDNGLESYNEPLDMKNDLVAGGIPDSVIYLDYAGFRTLDSVIRMHKIFGQQHFTVISQKFHNERAIYIARKNNLEAYGYNARDVGRRTGFKTMVREKFARVKVFADMLVGKKPKFLGQAITIN